MKLQNTEKLLKEMYGGRMFDTYAVAVHAQKENVCFFSPNADAFTYFDIASMGKALITAPLALKAMDEKLLSLNSTVGEFFPVADSVKRNITVRQMLTHTSGILRKPITEEAVRHGHDGIAACILDYPLGFAPDSDSVYSCNAIMLLGFILEKLYGKSLEELYKEKIAGPLGLERTAFEIGLQEENAAVCYRWKETPKQRFDSERVLLMGCPAGSGGQQSCLHDIAKYLDAVLAKDGRLYAESFFSLAETDYTSAFDTGRGLGYLMVDERYPQTGRLFPAGSFGHCGHTGQSFFVNREKDLYVIILTNATRFSFIKHDFEDYCYADIMKMREEIHNAVYEDLRAEGKMP